MAEHGCSDPEIMELPPPEYPSINCGAGMPVPDPPTEPPPNYSYVGFLVYEDGEDRQFPPAFLPTYPNATTVFPHDRPFGTGGFRGNIPFGERIYSGAFLPIPYIGTGMHPPLFGYGFPGAATNANRALTMTLMFGSRNGPNNAAPSRPLLHLPDNTVFARSIRNWHSLSPLIIESYSPFEAYTCMTNIIHGHGQETQYGAINYGSGPPIYSQYFWSPASAALAGSTVRIKFSETAYKAYLASSFPTNPPPSL